MLLTAVAGVTTDPALPLRFAVHDGDTIVLARPSDDWWRPLSTAETTPVTVRHKGHRTQMTAILAEGEMLDEAVLRYLQKYPGEWRRLGVDAAADEGAMQEAAHGSAVILFRPV